MQKGQTQVLILAGIVLLIAVAGGIFFLGRTTAPKTDNLVITPSPQPSPTPASTTDETANWKTYTNTNYGFSFKYPPDLSTQTGLSVTSFAYDVQLKTESYNISFCKPNYCDNYNIDKPQALYKTIPGITIGGKPAVRKERAMKISESNRANYQIVHTISLEDEYFMTIEANALDGMDPNDLRNKLDQILSTFKFTN